MGYYNRPRRNNDIERMIKGIRNDPYYSTKMTYDYFGGNVPKITVQPEPHNYGLPNNAEEVVAKEKENRKNKRSNIVNGFLISGYLILLYFYLNACGLNIFAGQVKTGMDILKVLGIMACAVMIYLTPALIVESIASKVADFFVKDNGSLIESNYQKYKRDLQAFNYWKDLKTVNYWMSLDGHQYEKAVASVYRQQGYNAVVSKAGGDGGVDIILSKGDERIAVQCKHHKNAVSPAVARDLYGTMRHFGFTQGMIVSTHGFTSGVYDFVKDKPISLITLNQIIAMSNK